MAEAGDGGTWVRQAVSRAALDAPENRLADYDGQAIYDAPVVGVADGDDPLFERFRQVVSERHALPRELLQGCAGPGVEVGQVRVIVWALPFAEEVRRSNRGLRWPSRLYSLARNNGGALNFQLRRGLAEALRRRGWLAVAPLLTDGYDAFRSAEHTFSSSWSERHAAHAAGLGRFGLSGALITPAGANVRLGSVVTNMPLDPTPRPYGDHRAPCLESGGEGCGACIERCPVGAISRNGLDKAKCYRMRQAVRRECMDAYTGALHMLTAPIARSGGKSEGHSLGCALCQCGVPCEGCIPAIPVEEQAADA